MKKDDPRPNRNPDPELVRGSSPGGTVLHSRTNKNNPGKHSGILDWFYDFFVTPIINTLKNLIKDYGDVFRLLVPITWVTDLIKQAAPAAYTVDKALAPEAATSPEAAAAAAPYLMKTLDKNLADVVTTLLGVETASAGMVDISTGRAADLPPIKFLTTISNELREARLRSGFLPMYTRSLLKQYTPFLPGYQDMISIYVREGYLEDHQVELPAQFTENMKELGYSESWTKQLWGKHWVLPGVELLYDMFHKKIIDYETLALMLKFHDFLPEWRDRLIRNAYTLIPRVDLRRAYMYAVPGYEDLVTPYEKLGYSPEDARTMDQIAKRFALSAYHTRLLTVARAKFRKDPGYLDKLKEVLVRVGVPAEAQVLVIEAENLARQTAYVEPGEEPTKPSATDMRLMAEWGLVGLPELTGFLEADGMDPEWAPLVAKAWMLNQLREELGKVRAVYEKRLREGFMSPAAFEAALEGIHYAPHVVDALAMWAEEELDLAEKIELADEYEKLAKDESITVDWYVKMIRELGMVEKRITRKEAYMKRLLAVKAMKEAAKKKG